MSKKETKTIKTEIIDESHEVITNVVDWKTTFAVLKTKDLTYQVLEIPFNPNAEGIKLVRESNSREEANEAFKIEIAKSGMLG